MAYATTTQVLNAVQKMKDYHDTHSSTKTYEEEINISSSVWSIQHNLGTQHPSKVYIFDADGNEVLFPEIVYDTINLMTVNFDLPIAGKIIIIQ